MLISFVLLSMISMVSDARGWVMREVGVLVRCFNGSELMTM